MAINGDNDRDTNGIEREPLSRQNLAMGQNNGGQTNGGLSDGDAVSRRFDQNEDYPVHGDVDNGDYDAVLRNASDTNFDDPDRLPWLDTADSYEDEGMSPMKLAGFVLGLLALLGLIIGGIYWLQNRNQGVGLGDGTGEMIAAQEGDYKVKPADAQGRSFEGEGDVAQATAEGRDVTTVQAASPGEIKPIANAAAQGATATGTAGAVATATASAATAGTGLVQLGAFADTGSADTMWSALSSRYAFLGSYQKKITTGSVEGRQVFRLNAVTADAGAAQKLCAQLKAAGATCLIPR